MAFPEPCDKREAAARIAVAHPDQLARDPWAAHLRECPDCRETCTGMARSLAVFRQAESERLARHLPAGPSWEQVAFALKAEPSHRLFLRRYRLPMAAAAVGGLLFVSGAGAWYSDVGGSGDTAPARIVRLQPEQQQRMQQVVRQSLSGSYGSPAAVADADPAPRLAPVEPVATEEVASEPAGLYASGVRLMPGKPVFRQTHPFLEGREMTTAVEPAGEPPNFPAFPVMSGPPGTNPVSFPVYRPNAR